MEVTKGLTGRPGPRDSTRPPAAEATAKHAESITASAGFAVTFTAAAPGVMSRASSSSAPTTCTPWEATTPMMTAKTAASSFTFTPEAAASTGSTVENSSGRHSTPTTTTTTAVTTASVPSDAPDTPTICPVSRA